MDNSGSEEEVDFIRRRPKPAIILSPAKRDENENLELRPSTPPMEQSLKVNKSLGLVVSPQSPPYRRIRSMRLAESPCLSFRSRLDQGPVTSTPSPKGRKFFRFPRGSNLLHVLDIKEKLSVSCPSAYTNPFSPSTRTNEPKNSRFKRLSPCHTSLSNSDCGNEADLSADFGFKKPKLSDFNTSRYEKEFLELDVIGTGEHGCVFKCMNKVNGVEYAVKRSLNPVNNERIAHNEIFAHGVLEHPNIVRNYSNWTENDFVYLQNEYCNGGSLEEAIQKAPLDEKELRRILEDIGQGLRYMHSMQLAHMDIKPGNILINRGKKLFASCCVDEYSEDDESTDETVYKIGDLGHVVRLDEAVNVEEGDCRYLPREILNDDYSNLAKVDIFSLGLSLYEAAGGGPLPKNGEEWHDIRNGKLKKFPHLSSGFQNLLKRMVHPNPDQRPTASEILAQSSHSTVKEKLELKAAKHRILLLEKELQEVMKCVKVFSAQNQVDKIQTRSPNLNLRSGGERIIGKKSKRSHSTTSF